MLRSLLLLEDDVTVRRAVSRALRDRGYRVVARSTVPAAKAAVRRGDLDGHPFAIAILDLEVGDRLGTEVAMEVPDGTEIVFFTAATDPVLLERARRYGRVIRKDRPDELLTGLALAS